MTAQAKIELMPDWPARMGEDLASLYVGVSLTTFRDRVAKGLYPQPHREGVRKFWGRRQLDRFVDAQFGLADDGGSGDPTWDDLR
jgi:hypothetical protein